MIRLTILFTQILFIVADISCKDAISESSYFVGQCHNKWSNLQPYILPTQSQVGYAWIKYKVDDKFSSSKDAQTEMDSSPTPAVIGPNGKFYIVDDHHTLCALDYSGYEDTSVTLQVICDKRNLTVSAFWKEMSQEKLAYLVAHPTGYPNSLPVAVSYSQLPSSFKFNDKSKAFGNDPWRSIAGYSRKVEDAVTNVKCTDNDSKYCQRCFYRGCVDGSKSSGPGVPYFEFRWSYFMNYATYFDTSYWPSKDEWQTFYKLYSNLDNETDIDKIDTDDWFTAADNVISLCRSSNTGKYSLPENLYSDQQQLPGYVPAYVKLGSDPSCSLPTCTVKENLL